MPSLRPPRWRAALACTLAVLAAHALLFVALVPAWVDPEAPPHAVPMLNVRSIVAAAAPVPLEPAPAPARHVPAAPPAPRPRPTTPKAPAAPAPEPVARQEAAVVETDAAPSAPPEVPLPVYATRLPPQAGSWRYALQRGPAAGEATLTWQPAADGTYELRLEGRVAGLTVMDWVSHGTIDGAGLAPERFALRRRGRDREAANFQRDAGKITFSGPTHEFALLPGVQDRLSWLLQLAAVIDAAPERFGPGERVTLMVIGARGGANVWAFSVVGPETVADTPALKLVREARGPHDTRVEAWLDPVQGHLPLRVLLSQPEGATPALELRWLGASTAP